MRAGRRPPRARRSRNYQICLREPATLFFVHECAYQDVATFLGRSVATSNNRLHAAPLDLKQRMFTMMTSTLHANALPDDFANWIGRLIESRNDVVDALFDPAALPGLLIWVSGIGEDNLVRIPVLGEMRSLDVAALDAAIVADRQAGFLPASIMPVSAGPA
jgi:hypothetical protein